MREKPSRDWTPEKKEAAFRWLRADPARIDNIIKFAEQYMHTSVTNPVRIGSHEFYQGISRGIYDNSQGIFALWCNLFIRSGRAMSYVYYLNKDLLTEIKALQKDISIVQFNKPILSGWVSVQQLEEQLQFLLEAADKIRADIEIAKRAEQMSKEKRILELQQELQALGA